MRTLVVVTDQGIHSGGQARTNGQESCVHVVSAGQRHVIEFYGATSVDKGSLSSARCGSWWTFNECETSPSPSSQERHRLVHS